MVDSDRNVYGSGVASLIGDSGISLDGQSVQLPEDASAAGYDLQDDVSSINTASVYRSDPPQIKIVGTVDQMEEGNVELVTPASALTNNTGGEPKTPKADEKALSTAIPLSVGEINKKAPNMKNTSKLSVEGKRRRYCCPIWISDAPRWLKCVIVVSFALLVGAIALVSVALTTAISEQEEGSKITSSAEAQDNKTPSFPQTIVSSPAPSPMASAVIAAETDTTKPVADDGESTVTSPASSPMQSTSSGQNATESPTFSPKPDPAPSRAPAAKETPRPTQAEQDANSPTTTPEIESVTAETPGGEEDNKPGGQQPGDQDDPYDSFVTTFFVTGGRFTSDALTVVPDQLKTLPVRGGTSFMVHLGDWNSPYATRCDRQSYQHVNELFSNSSIPVYFIPGDNDYNDCPNPNQALSFWHAYLQDYETQYWDPPTQWAVDRDAEDRHPENFAFVYNEILFVGINLVGGVVHNATEWENRQAANLVWIEDNFQLHKESLSAFVLFAHADPDVPSNSPFYEPFKERVKREYNQIPVVLIHRNLGVEPWSWETEFENIDNFSVVVVAGSVWPPLMGAVDFRQKNPFVFDQSNWYDDFMEHRKDNKKLLL